MRMSSLDSILVPATGADGPLDRAELSSEHVVELVDVDLAPAKISRRFQ